jgi:hypothetical protein
MKIEAGGKKIHYSLLDTGKGRLQIEHRQGSPWADPTLAQTLKLAIVMLDWSRGTRRRRELRVSTLRTIRTSRFPIEVSARADVLELRIGRWEHGTRSCVFDSEEAYELARSLIRMVRQALLMNAQRGGLGAMEVEACRLQ